MGLPRGGKGGRVGGAVIRRFTEAPSGTPTCVILSFLPSFSFFLSCLIIRLGRPHSHGWWRDSLCKVTETHSCAVG